jgi:hypothetical protein
MTDLRSRLQQTTGSALNPSDECLEVLAENADALVDRVCFAGSEPRSPVALPVVEPEEKPTDRATSWLMALAVIAVAFGVFLLVLALSGQGATAASAAAAPPAAGVSAVAPETCSMPVSGLPGTDSCSASTPQASP